MRYAPIIVTEILLRDEWRRWRIIPGCKIRAQQWISCRHYSSAHGKGHSMVDIGRHIRIRYSRMCHQRRELKAFRYVRNALDIRETLTYVFAFDQRAVLGHAIKSFQLWDKPWLNMRKWSLRIAFNTVAFGGFLLGDSWGSTRAIHLQAKPGIPHPSSMPIGNFEILRNFVPVNLINTFQVSQYLMLGRFQG